MKNNTTDKSWIIASALVAGVIGISWMMLQWQVGNLRDGQRLLLEMHTRDQNQLRVLQRGQEEIQRELDEIKSEVVQ